jgi:hypothetical protein
MCSHVLSHVQVLSQVFVIRFWWIIKKALEKFWCIGSLLGVPLCVVEVIYFHFASCFAFTRLYVEI